MTIEYGSSWLLRPHRHRHRPRRLCLRHPRGAARPEDRGGREARDLRRHLPQHRLHPVEGAAARLRAVRGGRPHASARWASASPRPSSISPAMMAFKDQGVDGNVKGVEFLLKKNKVDTFHGAGAHRRARQGRGQGRRRQDADARHQIDRHRHRLRRRAPQGHRDRREAHRLLDRRAGARRGAGASAGGRRRRDRARARLGLAAARRAR